MKRMHRNDTPLAEQAARWLHEIEKDGGEKQAQFAAWLKESPRHIEEALCAAAVDKALNRLRVERWPDVSSYLANPTASVIRLSEETAASRTMRANRRPTMWISAVAAALVCAVGGWWLHSKLRWDQYATSIGEQRTLTLDDGSLAYLNTRSQLNVRFSTATREVLLVDGEALFKVERDPTRPFLVRTDDAVIRAVGTEFNVYRRADSTVVSVVEGVVEVSTGEGSPRFAAGEQAHIANGAVTRTEKVDASRTAAWRERRLVFELDPLAEVAAEFNRYNRAPQIRVEGEMAQLKRFSGVFDVDDPRALVSLLATYQDLSVEQRADEIVVRAR